MRDERESDDGVFYRLETRQIWKQVRKRGSYIDILFRSSGSWKRASERLKSVFSGPG